MSNEMIGMIVLGVLFLRVSWKVSSIRDRVQELREANERLAQSRIAERLDGLASVYDRFEIPLDNLLGTLKGFSLGMSETTVHDLVAAGAFTVGRYRGNTRGLCYSLDVVDWQLGDWTADLVIHGGLLHEVWLTGWSCPPGTRLKIEAALRLRFGDPEPMGVLPERFSPEERAAFEESNRDSIYWSERSLGLRARIFGDDTMVSVQARLVGSYAHAA